MFRVAILITGRSVEVSLEDAVELFIAADLYTLDRLKVIIYILFMHFLPLVSK